MTTPESNPAGSDGAPPAGGHHPPSARSEFFGGCAWIALGVAIVIGSWTMDRMIANFWRIPLEYDPAGSRSRPARPNLAK